MKANATLLLGVTLVTALVLISCGSTSPTKTVTLYTLDVRGEAGKGGQPGTVTVSEEAEKVHSDPEVIERSTNVTAVTRVTDFQGSRMIDGLSMSPDGSEIVFQAREASNYWNVWSVATNGSHLRRITNGRYLDTDPTFANGGNHVYFSSNRVGGDHKLWRVNYGRPGGLTQVTLTRSYDFAPAVTQSGGIIAFSSIIPGAYQPQIWTLDMDSQMMTQLREGTNPRWSTDHAAILYEKEDQQTRKIEIWVMNADGSNLTRLIASGNNNKDASWSPDGSQISFASDRGTDLGGTHNYDIWIVNADGTDLTQLTTNGSYDDQPLWSDDGRYIYFRSNRGLSWDVWRMKLTDSVPIIPVRGAVTSELVD